MECVLEDKPETGAPTKAPAAWFATTSETGPSTEAATGEIPLNLAITSATPSSLSLQCKTTIAGAGVKIVAENGSLVAVETTKNS